MTTAQKILLALAGLGLLVAGFALVRSESDPLAGATSAVTHLEQGVWWFNNTVYFGSNQQLAIGSAGTLKTGLTGTSVAGFNFGTCYIRSSSATIAATTTITADCQAGTTGAQAPLAGVTTNDSIDINQSSTTPTLYEGLEVRGASASSTPGYITMTIYNGTGNTFTWTAAASSSFAYRAWR